MAETKLLLRTLINSVNSESVFNFRGVLSDVKKGDPVETAIPFHSAGVSLLRSRRHAAGLH